MKLIIAGSTAMHHWYPESRKPSDLDIISREEPHYQCDWHWIEAFQYILDNNKDPKYIDPDFLYTLKCSHASWDIKWDKTMHDIVFLRKSGCKIDTTLYNMLYKSWETIHGPKHVSLKGSPEEFFTSTITRKYDHESLHRLVAFGDAPMHTRIRKDPNNVAVSRELWDKLTYQEKIYCAAEEASVFALERYLAYPPRIAYYKALKQLITSSTKGWFNLFLIENFNEIYYTNNDRYNKLYEELK